MPGGITHAEFRGLLRRHHLDVGFEEEDVAAIMERFPSQEGGSTLAGDRNATVSWRGFIETLLGADDGVVEPQEVEEYVRLVQGIGRPLEEGAGTAPEVYQHRPRGSAWGVDPYNAKAVAAYDARREGAAAADDEIRFADPGVGEETEIVEEVDDADAEASLSMDEGRIAAGGPGAWYADAARADREREPIGVSTAPLVPHQPKPSFVDENGITVDPEEGPAPPHAGYALAKRATREQVMERLRSFFKFRGAQLRRVLSLYGRPSAGLITLDSAANALESAGFELRLDEREAILPGSTGPSARESMVRTEELLAEVMGLSFTM